MTIYARIQDGIVAELFTTDGDITEMFHPELIWVDCSSVEGISAAWTYDGSIFSAPPPPPPPSLAEQALAALSIGCRIISASTPALSGIYAVDTETRADILAEMVALLSLSAFTNGSDAIDWPDTSGAMHSFTAPQFKTFAAALGSFVGTLKPIATTGVGALPAQPSTIA